MNDLHNTTFIRRNMMSVIICRLLMQKKYMRKHANS